MTRSDIIRMARETGFEQLGPDIEDWVCFTNEIERFADLVAAAEREAIIDIVAMHGGSIEIEAAIRARGEKR